MAGLLDFDDPGTRMGLGLLAAGMAPRAQSGQMLIGLLNSMDQLDERKANAKYREAQIADLQRKTNMAQQQQNMLAGLFGGGAGGVQAGASGAAPLADPASQAAPAAAPGGGFGNATLAQIAAIKAFGGPDLLEHYKLNQTGAKMDAGNYYVKDGKPIYLPKAGEGIMVDPRTGQAVALPGYAEANAAIEGAKTGATEGAKYPYAVGLENAKANIGASNDLVTLNLPTGPVQVTRAQALSMTQGQPAQGQGPFVGGGQNLTPQLRALIAQDAAANGIDNPVTNFQGAGRGQAYGLTNVPARGPGIQLQSEAEKTRSVDSAKAGTERIMTGYDNARTAADMIASIGESRKAIQGGSFIGSGAETKLAIAKGLQAMGFNVAPDQATNTDYLTSQLGQGILAKAKTLGTNPTDNDARIIRDIVGSIGKDPKALEKLLDYQQAMAEKAITQHNKNYTDARGRGFDAGFDLTVDLPQKQTASTGWTGGPVPKVLMKGQMVGGWRFKGGDPKEQSNWEQAR